VVDYILLQDYYATELCINKNNPDKNCNGVCQLNKELSSTSHESDRSTPINLQELNISSFILPEDLRWFIQNYDDSDKEIIAVVCFYHKDFENKTLKPPKPSC
jgi:hypothetical protein